MSKILFIIQVVLCVSAFAGGKINVVASIPDLGDMAMRIGGDKAKVIVLATGREDLHAVPVRPSFLPILNRADLLLTLGLDAEHSWLPALAAEARNAKIMEGRPGWIEVSEGIHVHDIPEILDRSEGEQHPEGNPHYNIGPQCGTSMANNIYKALLSAAPEHKDFLRANRDQYVRSVDTVITSLKQQSSALKGIPIIGYHEDLVYLCEFYGIKVIGYIEPKAGVSPTAGHLREIESLGREQGVKLIIHNQTQSPRIPEKLGKSLNCPIVEIANTVGAKKEITTWLELQLYNNRVLLEALKKL